MTSHCQESNIQKRDKTIIVGFSAAGIVEDWTADFDCSIPTVNVVQEFRCRVPDSNNLIATAPLNTASKTSSADANLHKAHDETFFEQTNELTDSDDDWDTELECADQDVPHQPKHKSSEFKSFLKMPSMRVSKVPNLLDTREHRINTEPTSWLLRKALRCASLTIIRYPQPPALYSLTAENGYPIIGEKQMDHWLSHCIRYRSNKVRCAANNLTISVGNISQFDFFSAEHRTALQFHLVNGIKLKPADRMEAFTKCIVDFFNRLTKLPATFDFDLNAIRLVLSIISIMSRCFEELRKVLDSHNISINCGFQKLVQLLPDARWYLQIIELRFLLHNIDTILQTTQYRIIGTENAMIGKGNLLQQIFDTYHSIFCAAASQTVGHCKTNFYDDPISLMAMVLNDLYFCSCNLSPITAQFCSEALRHIIPSKQIGDTDIAGFGEENEYLQYWQVVGTTSQRLLLHVSSFRMDLLLNLYSKLAPNFPEVKAMSALLLGHYVYTALQDSNGAESLVYEALRIMDRSPLKIEYQQDMLLGSIGMTSLELLGEILMQNHKYRYGVQCFEAVIMCHKTSMDSEPERLLRRLCSACLQLADTRRSIPYHRRMYAVAENTGNVSEVVYLSGVLSEMLFDSGSLTESVDCLLAALRYLNENVAGVPPVYDATKETGTTFVQYSIPDHVLEIKYRCTDGKLSTVFPTRTQQKKPFRGKMHRRSKSKDLDASMLHYINLHTKLSDIYACAGKVNRACTVICVLLAGKLPPGRRSDLLMALADLYLRKRAHYNCYAILLYLEADILFVREIKGEGTSRNSTDLDSFDETCTNTKPTMIVQSFRYVECRIKCYLYANDVISALYWLASALQFWGKSKDAMHAKLLLLESKVYTALHEVRHSMSRRQLFTQLTLLGFGLPTSIVLPIVSEDEITTALQKIVQCCWYEEGIRGLSVAYDILCKEEDLLQQLKCLNKLNKYRINLVFEPVVVWKTPLNSKCEIILADSSVAVAVALELSREYSDPVENMECLLNMSEYCVLASAIDDAKFYWKDLVEILDLLLSCEPEANHRNIDADFLASKQFPLLHSIISRTLRLSAFFNVAPSFADSAPVIYFQQIHRILRYWTYIDSACATKNIGYTPLDKMSQPYIENYFQENLSNDDTKTNYWTREHFKKPKNAKSNTIYAFGEKLVSWFSGTAPRGKALPLNKRYTTNFLWGQKWNASLSVRELCQTDELVPDDTDFTSTKSRFHMSQSEYPDDLSSVNHLDIKYHENLKITSILRKPFCEGSDKFVDTLTPIGAIGMHYDQDAICSIPTKLNHLVVFEMAYNQFKSRRSKLDELQMQNLQLLGDMLLSNRENLNLHENGSQIYKTELPYFFQAYSAIFKLTIVNTSLSFALHDVVDWRSWMTQPCFETLFESTQQQSTGLLEARVHKNAMHWENDSLFEELYVMLGQENLLRIIFLLLMDTSIIIVGKHIADIYGAMHTVMNLIRPFKWNGTFIPFLPSNLLAAYLLHLKGSKFECSHLTHDNLHAIGIMETTFYELQHSLSNWNCSKVQPNRGQEKANDLQNTSIVLNLRLGSVSFPKCARHCNICRDSYFPATLTKKYFKLSKLSNNMDDGLRRTFQDPLRLFFAEILSYMMNPSYGLCNIIRTADIWTNVPMDVSKFLDCFHNSLCFQALQARIMLHQRLHNKPIDLPEFIDSIFAKYGPGPANER